jgi:MFS family permease
MGLSDAEVLLTTIASLLGGLASLYLWGRAVDRLGPAPVFLSTAVGMALLCFALLTIEGSEGVAPMIGFFFALTVLASGFGVADTHVLFSLAPPEAPTRMFVLAAVLSSFAYGLAPLLAGVALDTALGLGVAPLSAYRGLFLITGVVVLLALVPLRVFRR